MRFRRPITMPSFKIDWPNHIIGFFSALFGILIAFELDEWRQTRSEQQIALNAFTNLKNEVDLNKNILHENVQENLKTLHSLQSLLPRIEHNLSFSGSKREADSLNKQFGRIIFIDVSDSLHSPHTARWPVHFGVGSITVPSLQASAWESAKATGALNFLSYEKVASLSFVYNDARISDELAEIRRLWRNSDNVRNKEELITFLLGMEKSHLVLDRELEEFDKFANMLNIME